MGDVRGRQIYQRQKTLCVEVAIALEGNAPLLIDEVRERIGPGGVRIVRLAPAMCIRIIAQPPVRRLNVLLIWALVITSSASVALSSQVPEGERGLNEPFLLKTTPGATSIAQADDPTADPGAACDPRA